LWLRASILRWSNSPRAWGTSMIWFLLKLRSARFFRETTSSGMADMLFASAFNNTRCSRRDICRYILLNLDYIGERFWVHRARIQIIWGFICQMHSHIRRNLSYEIWREVQMCDFRAVEEWRRNDWKKVVWQVNLWERGDGNSVNQSVPRLKSNLQLQREVIWSSHTSAWATGDSNLLQTLINIDWRYWLEAKRR